MLKPLSSFNQEDDQYVNSVDDDTDEINYW